MARKPGQDWKAESTAPVEKIQRQKRRPMIDTRPRRPEVEMPGRPEVDARPMWERKPKRDK